MSNCPDFLRGCRASAGSQRDLTPSEHERIIGQAAELSDYAKCSYLWTRLCALHVINAPAGVAGWHSRFRFQDGHTGLGLLLKRAPASRSVCGSPFFPAE